MGQGWRKPTSSSLHREIQEEMLGSGGAAYLCGLWPLPNLTLLPLAHRPAGFHTIPLLPQGFMEWAT